MPIFDYMRAFETYIIQDVMCIVGYLLSMLGYFTFEEAIPMLRIVRIMSWPALCFRELALSKCEANTYKPLLHSFLTQLTVHLIAFLASLPKRFGTSRIATFCQFVFAYSYNSFFCYGYPIIRILFGDAFLYIPVVMNMVQTYLMKPLHLVALYRINPRAADRNVEPQFTEDMFANKATESIHRLTEDELDGEGNRSSKSELENVPVEAEEGEEPYDMSDSDDEKPVVPHHRRKNLILATLSTANICAIAGICWSITGWKIPVILETVVKYNEFCIVGTSIFAIGVLMWNHPVRGCPWKLVAPFLVAHHVITPLIAIFWAWALGFDPLNQRACVIMFTMPIELTGVWLTAKFGIKPSPVTYTAFWSQVIGLPMFFVWLAILNETGLFA